MGEDYSVDSGKTKTLVSVLRRVAEMLEDNYSLSMDCQIWMETQGYFAGQRSAKLIDFK